MKVNGLSCIKLRTMGINGKGLCVRAVIENLNFKYRTNDK